MTVLSNIKAFTLQYKQTQLSSSMNSSTCKNCSHDHSNRGNSVAPKTDGIYRAFMNYAWDKLYSSGLIKHNTSNQINESNEQGFLINSSPASRSPEGTVVNVEIQCKRGTDQGSLRLGRFALLETLTPSKNNQKEDDNDDDTKQQMVSYDQGIHVLNLVLFPNIHQEFLLPLPILGMDLVSLPGGKHLIAIDFQPITQLDPHDVKQKRLLFPNYGKYAKYECKIQELYEKHVVNQKEILPFGGEIPQPASRFFSPYALWTRLKSDDMDNRALQIIHNEIFCAFCEYFDLYLELLVDVQKDLQDSNGEGKINETQLDNDEISFEDIKQGHCDYLSYRQQNDPARPMLTRLYGNQWTEEVISEILFKMI